MPLLQMGKQPQRVILSLGHQDPQGIVFSSQHLMHILSSPQKVELAHGSFTNVDSRLFSAALSHGLGEKNSERI